MALCAEDPLFAKAGKMVDVGKGSALSMVCIGTGSPTIVLESGFGGGTAATWSKLQPRLGAITRTCSYDRAGYGFSSLGSNLPRDLNHAVVDLATLLQRSGEKAPYLLVGHSNGGLIIGAFADRFPKRVAGLVFLDAAVALPADRQLPRRAKHPDAFGRKHLDRIRGCLRKAEQRLLPDDDCVTRNLPATEIANLSKSEYWRAYLSEAEENYSSRFSEQARKLLPHKWTSLSIRVFVASASAMDDAAAAKAFGLDPDDISALTEARGNRLRGEQRQRDVCKLSRDCQVVNVPTGNHLVHDEALEEVANSIRDLIAAKR